MNQQHNIENWHLLADRFIWYDASALTLIPEEVSDEEIKQYLYTFHGDNMPIEEIKKWRGRRIQDQ